MQSEVGSVVAIYHSNEMVADVWTLFMVGFRHRMRVPTRIH